MGRNALGQSDNRIFKSTTFLEQNYEKAYFFTCGYISMETTSRLKNIGVGTQFSGL